MYQHWLQKLEEGSQFWKNVGDIPLRNGKGMSCCYIASSHSLPHLHSQFVQWTFTNYSVPRNSFIASLLSPSLTYSVPPRRLVWPLKLKLTKTKFGPTWKVKFTFRPMRIFQVRGGRFICTVSRGNWPKLREGLWYVGVLRIALQNLGTEQ